MGAIGILTLTEEIMPSNYIVEFRGRALRRDEGPNHRGEDRKTVFTLNENADDIAERIKTRLRKTLPMSANVEVEIEFSNGSIEWLGVVFILDWMGRLSGSISLIEYISRAVRLVVNRSVREGVRNFAGPPWDYSYETETTMIQQPDAPAGVRESSALFDNSLRTLLIFLAVNTLVLIAVLALQIYTMKR
ncbi:MAG: hypothetical protein ABR577_04055 [Pyrinomonadaceae bacterium]